jgi:hypothetical protein
MKRNIIRLQRVKSLAGRLKGDPRSVFYGDATVDITPESASGAIGHEEAPQDVAVNAIADNTPSEEMAAAKVAAYNAMSEAEKASRTMLPPLACWNAMVILNPMLGKVLAAGLDYMLVKTLNDYPYEGGTFFAGQSGTDPQGMTSKQVVINSESIGRPQGSAYCNKYITVPFFRFTISASTLNAAPGSQVKINIRARNPEGVLIDTFTNGYTYSIQRMNSVEAVMGIYIPTQVVSTRTLPFLPIAGDAGTDESVRDVTITFSGVSATDVISVTIPGYSTGELREIASMYNLPSGLIR